MSRDRMNYRYAQVGGQLVAYIPHPAGDGVTVVAGLDPVSRRPIVTGTAYRTTGRAGRHPRTLLESRGRMWHLPGWLSDADAAAAIDRR